MRFNYMTKSPETNEVVEVQQTHFYPFGLFCRDLQADIIFDVDECKKESNDESVIRQQDDHENYFLSLKLRSIEAMSSAKLLSVFRWLSTCSQL